MIYKRIILKYINVSFLLFSRWSFPEPWSWDDTTSCPAPGQIRGRGINCHPGGVEELSQVSGYYSAMRGSWELFCSVLWMFRPLRPYSFMWDYERNGANSYRMKEILSKCALLCVWAGVILWSHFQENVNIWITCGLL